mmetsp:Transcript_61057/g.101519  ORF Transcript_61057/g.101519 Transcript_61057/m.101519 type:complete len:87 (+) Transcript_61057:864-1124(+)
MNFNARLGISVWELCPKSIYSGAFVNVSTAGECCRSSWAAFQKCSICLCVNLCEYAINGLVDGEKAASSSAISDITGEWGNKLHFT